MAEALKAHTLFPAEWIGPLWEELGPELHVEPLTMAPGAPDSEYGTAPAIIIAMIEYHELRKALSYPVLSAIFLARPTNSENMLQVTVFLGLQKMS